MLPFYWQGSVIGAIIGFAVIVVLGWLFVREKRLDLIANLSTLSRVGITAAVLSLWLATFINVGIRQVPGDRAVFDQVGTLVDPDTKRVEMHLRTPEDAKRDAAATRKEIDAGNLNK